MLCDTNILIAYVSGEQDVIRFLHSLQSPLYISVITVVEILALQSLTKNEISIIQTFLNSFEIIEVNNQLALQAATLCRLFTLKVPDSIIGATALNLGMPLATRDKAFNKVKGLEVIEI